MAIGLIVVPSVETCTSWPSSTATKPSSVLVGVTSRGPAGVSGADLPFAQLSSWPVVALANSSAGGAAGGLRLGLRGGGGGGAAGGRGLAFAAPPVRASAWGWGSPWRSGVGVGVATTGAWTASVTGECSGRSVPGVGSWRMTIQSLPALDGCGL